MIKRFKSRTWIVSLCFLLIFVLLVGRLFDMQWRQGASYYEESVSSSRRTIRETGTRGAILDANGIPLAYDQKAYDVQFVKDPTRNRTKYTDGTPGGDVLDYTRSIQRTIEILEANDAALSVDCSIHLEQDGSFAFYWGNGVSESVAQTREKNWRDTMGIKKGEDSQGNKYDLDAEGCYRQLRERYFIDEAVPDEMALKILAVWQNVRMTSYTSYIPITIAENVSMQTVAQLETESLSLDGVQIDESTVRIYPKDEMAAQLMGYMGRMSSEETILEMEAQGYSRDDLIGVAGVEKTMEAELSGCIGTRTGETVVEVNSKSKVIRTFPEESTPAQSGNDVMLTIDSRLQKVVEDALADNIELIRTEQQRLYDENKAEYDQKVADRGGGEISMASTGAAVVMNVHTGAVLAMANLPSYDANLFTGGISTEDYAAIANDPDTPLMNKAIASRAAPGSIFKMATGLAGLMEGAITPETLISDQGEFRDHISSDSPDIKGPSCWKKNWQAHANQNLVRALKNSCNYFFFSVAYELGIDKLNKWASLLGLDSKTNVELPGELSGQLASQETLYDPEKEPTGTSAIVYNQIRKLLVDTCTELGYDYEDEKYDQATRDIMKVVEYAGEQEYGADIRAVLRTDLKIDTQTISQKAMTSQISGWLNDIIWNSNQTIVAGIGQSVTLLTPIGVARYLSALVNGGKVYDATIIDSVISPEGKVVSSKTPQLVRTLDVPESYLELIKEGMREVVSEEDGGTASDFFKGFKYNGQFGGKTGTAQVSKIDLENNSWFVAFAPFDDPEIAIVVYIPHGYAGGWSYATVKAVIEYYMESKETASGLGTIPTDNALVP